VHKFDTANSQYFKQGLVSRIIESNELIQGNSKYVSKNDIYSDGKVMKTLNKAGANIGASISTVDKPSSSNGDAMSASLSNVFMPYTLCFMPFENFSRIAKIQTCSVNKEKGIERRVITFEYQSPGEPKSIYRCTFNSNMNNIIEKIEIDLDSSGMKHIFQATKFNEVNSAIYFPSEMSRECYVKGKLKWNAKYTITQLRINAAVSQDAVNFKFPHGIEVFDTIKSSKYKVDQDGNRITEEKHMQSGIMLRSSEPLERTGTVSNPNITSIDEGFK
jgi:hypothetical protein